MKLKDMIVGKRYIVTKPSDDGEFHVGDRISLSDDGSILDINAGGWMDLEHIVDATKGMECEIDHKWLALRKAKLQAELEALG
jgi:hypothetical protein